MQTILLIPAAVFALWLIWCVFTWYFADNGKLVGPPEKDRVTFKQVLINSLYDVRDLLGLRQIWAWLVKVWRYCGETLGAMLLTFDAYIASTPELKAALSATPYGLYILLAINFFAFIAVKVSGKHQAPPTPAAP